MAIDFYKEWLGIPEGPRPPDHYQLLRLVQFEDDVEKVRKNYKKLNGHVRKYASGQYSVQSQDLLNELAKAMLCLTDEESKVEYDRSLGRVIDDRDEFGRRPMTSFLQDEGLISSDQSKEAIAHAERTGLTVRDAIVQLKMVDHESAARAYASELGRSYVDLADLMPENAAMDMVPKAVVRRHNCLPLFIEANAVVVACADEPDAELEDEIRLRFGKPIRPVIASGKSINQAITTNYAEGMRKAPPDTIATTKAKTQTAGSKTSEPKPRVQAKDLTEDQKEERRKLGIIAICWSIAGPALFVNYVLTDLVIKPLIPWFVSYATYCTIVFVGIPLALWAYFSMVQKKK